MPTYHFGSKDEPASHLEESKDMIVVRTRSGKSLRNGPVMAAAAMELERAEMVIRFEDVGVEVYKMKKTSRSARTMNEVKEGLRAEDDVCFAGSVLVDPDSGEPVIYTENLFVKFKDDADPQEAQAVLKELGLQVKRELPFAANGFFVQAPEGTGQEVFAIAEKLLGRDDVEYSHPELVRRRRSRTIFPQQWHLQTTTVNGVPVAASANVAAAHAITEGAGTTIAVIDDGVDVDHIEFQGSGKVVAPRETSLPLRRPGSTEIDPRALDARPRSSGDKHGTACAGVACGRGFAGASGVAPAARLMPIRSVAGLGSMAEAEGFQWAADHGADVISCSWGPADGDWSDPDDPLHLEKVPLPASTKMAIDYALTRGRGGKGCVVLFAAGNGNESVDNDGYASYPGVIAVAACNDRGKRSVYSDFGAAVWCSFPSNDFQFPAENRPRPLTRGIWTVDRTGTSGYNRGGGTNAGDTAGLFTDSFGGTSSACPGAAGVAALVIAVNPDLTGVEVRDILRRSCQPIDMPGGSYDAEGRSPLYGYGRLDAGVAVRLAGEMMEEVTRQVVGGTFNVPIPDQQTVEVSLAVGESRKVTDFQVEVELLHTFVGDLVISLLTPAGAEVVLQSRQGGATRNLKKIWRAGDLPGLAALRGQSFAGTWKLRVADKAAQDQGTLVRFALDLTLGS
jgi:subtilisin family serine protease